MTVFNESRLVFGLINLTLFSFNSQITLYAPNCIDLSTTISNGQTSITTSTKIRYIFVCLKY